MSEDHQDHQHENNSADWERFSSAVHAIQGIRPSKRDKSTEYIYQIWKLGYIAGSNDKKTP